MVAEVGSSPTGSSDPAAGVHPEAASVPPDQWPRVPMLCRSTRPPAYCRSSSEDTRVCTPLGARSTRAAGSPSQGNAVAVRWSYAGLPNREARVRFTPTALLTMPEGRRRDCNPRSESSTLSVVSAQVGARGQTLTTQQSPRKASPRGGLLYASAHGGRAPF